MLFYLLAVSSMYIQSVCPVSICIYSPDTDPGADASGSYLFVFMSCCDTGMPLGEQRTCFGVQMLRVGKVGGCKVEGLHPVKLNVT